MAPKKIKSRVVKLPAHQLRIHPTAQRALVPTRLKELQASFDLDAIGVLHGVEYEIDGVTCIWIIDGQHRWQVLIDQGFAEWEVEVKVHTDVQDDARASELFLKLNNRRAVTPFDTFQNSCRAKETEALGIRRILEDNALKVARGADDGSICCISALRRIYRVDEGATLAATIETLRTAYGRIATAVEGQLVEGLGLVYKTYNGTIDRPALVKKLSKYPGGASGLLGDAKGLREYRHVSVPRCVAEQVLEMYNSGRKTRLDPL